MDAMLEYFQHDWVSFCCKLWICLMVVLGFAAWIGWLSITRHDE